MPAKTVADLVEFNKLVSPEHKVHVNYKITNARRMEVFFSDSRGIEYKQTDSRRLDYYNEKGHSWELEPKTGSSSISRLKDPVSSKPVFPWGYVGAHSNGKFLHYRCHNAWIFGSSLVAKGYGPMLYDCLLVLLAKQNNGLTSDRELVSSEASNVWVNYFENRSDVISKPLDYDGITPETDDDCWSDHELNPDWNSWVREPEKEDHTEETLAAAKKKKETTTKALAHAYFDNGITTLAELSDAGLLLNNGQPTSIKESTVFQIYLSLLKETKSI